MIYRELGRTGLQVSLASLGTGGPSKLGQAAQLAPKQSHHLVHTALDLGINLFDTSPVYGNSEELLGAALVGIPRDRYIITTKFKPSGGFENASPDALTEQLDQSLRRLRIETVDVLQYHAVSAQEYTTVIARFHETALRARSAGKVRFLGITESVAQDTGHEMLTQALDDDLFDVVMVRYGILNQLADRKILPLAQRNRVGVLDMAPVRTSLRSAEEVARHLQQFVDAGSLEMKAISIDDPLNLREAGSRVPSVTAAAYQFAAAPPAISSVLVGTGNMDHLRDNVASLTASSLDQAQIKHLKQVFGKLEWHA